MSRLQSERNLDGSSASIEKAENKKVRSWDVSQKDAALKSFDAEANIETKPLPKDLQPLFDNAQILLGSGEAQMAKRVFLAILQKQPNFDPAHAGLINCLRAMGDQLGVLGHLKLRAESLPTFSNLFELAEFYYQAGELESAEGAYKEALLLPHVEGPALFSVYKNLGNLCLQRRDFAAAEEHYSKAYTLDDQSDVLLVNFGSLAIQRGQIDRALKCYRLALEINSSNPKAWIGLAVLHREFGDYELSWANLERALDLEPSNQTAAKLIAEWGMKDNEIERTIRLLQNYLKLQPKDAFQQMILAKYFYLIGNLQSAEKHIEISCRLDSGLQDAHSIREIIREEMTKAGLRSC